MSGNAALKIAKQKFLWLAVSALLAVPGLAQPNAQPRIEQVKDNVYRYLHGEYRSVFMVTEEGLFVTDPISTEAARHLRGELAKRFDVPVRFLTYSHNHVDHAVGGYELVDKDKSVTIIAHELAAEDLEWTRVPTAKPNLTFKDAMTVHLGDSEVRLKYHGSNNGRGSISMHFLPANVLYVVDWILLGRVVYKDLPGYDIHGMIHSTREVLATIDFDLFVGGHAEMGSRSDVEHYLDYLEALYGAVRDGMLAGKSLETLKNEIKLEDYAHLKMYNEWRQMNIEGVYNTLNDMSYFNLREDIKKSN